MHLPSSPAASCRSSRAIPAHRLRWALSAAVLLACAEAPIGCAQRAQTAARKPDVIYVPTPPEVVEQMLAVARVGPNDRLFDLGSGDGRIVIAAAKRLGTRGVGIDIDPQRIAESRRNADSARVTHLVEFREADLFDTDLRQATVVTLYLLPELNVKLRPKLFAELRPGSRVVSHSFDMGDWTSDSTFAVNGRTVHYWVMPASLAGMWTLATTQGGAERRYELRLQQQYQQVTGTATADGRAAALGDVRVRGDSVAFTLAGANGTEPLVFLGRVEGGRIAGTVASGAGGAGGVSWSATRTGR